VVQTLAKYKEEEQEEDRNLEERKLDYVHPSTGQSPQAQSTVGIPPTVVSQDANPFRSQNPSHSSLQKTVQGMIPLTVLNLFSLLQRGGVD